MAKRQARCRAHQRKKAVSVGHRLFAFRKGGIGIYLSNERICCGAWFAWESMAMPDCCRI